MKKMNNEEFFKAYNSIYLNNELSSIEQKVIILLIGFDRNKKGRVVIPNSTFVMYGIKLRTLNRIKPRLIDLGLIDIEHSKKDNGDNNPNVYIINKEMVNEFFNCKIYDIKEQVSVNSEPVVKSETVSQFEMFLNSKINKTSK